MTSLLLEAQNKVPLIFMIEGNMRWTLYSGSSEISSLLLSLSSSPFLLSFPSSFPSLTSFSSSFPLPLPFSSFPKFIFLENFTKRIFVLSYEF